jgi:hypothetical protein
MPDHKNKDQSDEVDRDRMNRGESQKDGQGSEKGSTSIENDDTTSVTDQSEDLGNQVEDDDRITQRSPRQDDPSQGRTQPGGPRGGQDRGK